MVIRFAAGIAEWEVDEEEAGDSAMLDDVLTRTQDYGWYAILFQMPCCQTHGLVANGSQRDQERRVGAIFNQTIQNIGRIMLVCVPMAVVRWHAMEAFGEPADHPFRD